MSQQDLSVEFEKDEVVFREGDPAKDLFKVLSGKLMICSRKNRMVTPLAFLNPGDYLGEFSFLDSKTRSADVIAVKKTALIQIPQAELKKHFPYWLIQVNRSLTKKMRLFNEVIRSKGIKRRNVETIKPLSIEEQRRIYQIITGES